MSFHNTPSLQDMKPTDFPVVTFDKVRYADTDRQGHVNNTVFASSLETGRVELLYDPEQPLMSVDDEFVIASLKLTFMGEIQWPGEVKIGTYISGIGNSSIHIGQALFQRGQCVAKAETFVVQIDRATRKAMALSEDTRNRLGKLTLQPHQSQIID